MFSIRFWLGDKTTEKLANIGIVSIEDVIKATDDKILSVKGIGEGKLSKIREYYSKEAIQHAIENIETGIQKRKEKIAPQLVAIDQSTERVAALRSMLERL